jgi:hypothetical protein
MKWLIEVEVMEDRVKVKVINPDGSWGIVENLVTEAGIVELGVTSHSENLDVEAFKMGMAASGYGFTGSVH